MRCELFTIVAVLVVPAFALSQTTWYVDDDNCPGPGSGTRGDPFCKIQDGLNLAQDGDTVLVLAGTYMENIDFLGKAITLVSSEGPRVTTIDGGGNGTVVTFENDEGPTSLLEGFTISNGYSVRGGGIRCIESSPTLRRNIIRDNTARIGGGGVHLTASSPLISSCVISYNDARSKGDGILCREGSAPRIIGTTVAYNHSNGLWVIASSVEITSCVLWSNPGDPIHVQSGDVNVRFSDIEGGWPGSGNIELDPAFVSAEDIHLLPTSPCIDSGIETDGDSRFDIDGDKRARGGSIDMGADEAFKRNSPPPPPDASRLGTTIWFVDKENCPEPGSGTKSDPFCKIQDAVDAARDGDLVLVMPAIYVENIDYLGKAITVRSDGDGDPATEDIAPESTIIDGDFAGPVVAFRSGEGLDSVLAGFTLTNGFNFWAGGGVNCEYSSPTITRNIIVDNFGYDFAGMGGGGIGCYQSSALITNNTITANATTWRGGGIGCEDSKPIITNNLITENDGYEGGGICCASCPDAIISNNTITGNTSSRGAGICCWGSPVTITHNTIMGNSAEHDGGGLWIEDFLTVSHNIIAANSAGWSGGGIHCWRSSAIIINNTINGNSAGVEAGGIGCYYDSYPIVKNTIFWNDKAPSGPEIGSDSLEVSYCDVEGGWPGAGNIDADPLFIGPGGADDLVDGREEQAFRLRAGSPCIDAGDPSDDTCTEKDILGYPRVLDGDLDRERRIDIGASEFDNVHLRVRGDATPGGKLMFDTRGLHGLSVMMFVGTASGAHCLPDWGAVFIDFSSPWRLQWWRTVPNSIQVTLPAWLPAPSRLVFQELALSGTSGNTSNPVEILID